MSKDLPKGVATVIIAVFLAFILFLSFRALKDPAGSLAGQKPPGMPPEIAAEFAKAMSRAKPPPSFGPPAPSSSPVSKASSGNQR